MDLAKNFFGPLAVQFCPTGWFYLSVSDLSQRSQNQIGVSQDFTSLNISDYSESTTFKRPRFLSDPLYYFVFGPVGVENAFNWFGSGIRTLDYSHLAYVACQIERYRMANGHLPPNLEAMPELAGQPAALDVLTNQPFAYHLIGTDDYRLYSFGPNRKDDGGVYVGRGDSQGDWVWYSSPQAAK